MAAAKGNATFTWASGSSTTSGTTNPVSCATDYAQDLAVEIVVVGSPSAGAAFQPQYSFDGTKYYTLGTWTAPTTAGTYDWTINIPVGAQDVQIVYAQQTGGTSSTLTAQLGYVSGI